VDEAPPETWMRELVLDGENRLKYTSEKTLKRKTSEKTEIAKTKNVREDVKTQRRNRTC